MTNPYNHPGYQDAEVVAQEQTLATIEWQRELVHAEQRAVRGMMRRHAIRKLTQIGIGAVLLGGSLFVVIRYLYLYFFWQ